jgi:hypothetical protein
LFDLPSTLSRHLEKAELANAVRVFTQAATLLVQFRDKPGFEGIESESREIMDRVALRLRETIDDDKVDEQK